MSSSWDESCLNWLLSKLWIRPGLNTFTLKGLSVPSEGNLLQEHTGFKSTTTTTAAAAAVYLTDAQRGGSPRQPHLSHAARFNKVGRYFLTASGLQVAAIFVWVHSLLVYNRNSSLSFSNISFGAVVFPFIKQNLITVENF